MGAASTGGSRYRSRRRLYALPLRPQRTSSLTMTAAHVPLAYLVCDHQIHCRRRQIHCRRRVGLAVHFLGSCHPPRFRCRSSSTAALENKTAAGTTATPIPAAVGWSSPWLLDDAAHLASRVAENEGYSDGRTRWHLSAPKNTLANKPAQTIFFNVIRPM